MALTGKTVSTLMFHKRLTVERVAIHSFTKDDGTERHDVLLFFDYEGECLVERLRRAAAVEDCVQGRPHVTVGTFNTRQQAESRMALVIEHGVIGMGLRIIGVSWTTAA